MKFVEYRPLALRTVKPLPTVRQQIQHAVLGMITEMGELADAYKKHVIYGKDLDKVNVMEECADVFWYLNLWMAETGLPPGLVDFMEKQLTSAGSGTPKVDDPWDLVEMLINVTGLVGSLNTSAGERGVSDTAIVDTISATLITLIYLNGYTVADALKTNIDKLAKRYGDKYSDYAALNRDTAAERATLEGTPGV